MGGINILEYEKESSTAVPDEIKSAANKQWSLPSMLPSTQQTGQNYAPMEVDAVVKDKNDKKDKKDKNDNKDTLFFCGRKGHMQRDCWYYQQQQQQQQQPPSYLPKGKGGKKGGKSKGNGKGKKSGKMAAAVTSETPAAETEQWTAWPEDAWHDWDGWQEQAGYEDQWIFPVVRGEPLMMQNWLVDSGSAVNILPADGESEPTTSVDFKLRSATGAEIPQYGVKQTTLVADGHALANATCHVAKVRQPILSVLRLVEDGHEIVFSKMGSRVKFANGEEQTLTNYREVYYMMGANTVLVEPELANDDTVQVAVHGGGASSMADMSGKGAEIIAEAQWGEAEAMDLDEDDTAHGAPPDMPTHRERQLHQLTHVLYRAWCETCVHNRGRDNRHERKKAQDDDEQALPKIKYDFAKLLTRQLSSIGAWYTGSRSIAPYTVKNVLDFLDSLGHDKLIHHDQDKALEYLTKEIRDKRVRPVLSREGFPWRTGAVQ
eukprot:4143075-Amphidinium_carterae.3